VTREPVLDVGSMSEEQRRVYDAIAAGPRGVVRGPLAVWLQSPGLAQRAQDLGAFCRYGSSLPPRLSELAILVTGAHWRAGYEWCVHAPIARSAGLAGRPSRRSFEATHPRSSARTSASCIALPSRC